MKKKLLAILLAILFSGVVLGCRASSTTSQTTTTETRVILLEESDFIMALGSKAQIGYTLNFTITDGTVITFESDDETIASVSVLGEITGVGYGTATITVRFGEVASATVEVLVSNGYVVVPPERTIYSPGAILNLRGAVLEIRDNLGVLIESVPVTSAMIVSYDSAQTGTQVVTFRYEGVVYGFDIYILNAKQEASLFDDFILLETDLLVGQKIEFALTKSNLAAFLEAVDNVYDYDEIDIYALISTPAGDMQKVAAFWYQAYEENLVYTSINTALNLEGKVNNTATDYDLILQYVLDSDPQFRLRYLPDQAGEYACTLVVEVDGTVIQTFEKPFTVSEDVSSEYRGILEVDETNQRHFAYSHGGTYVPVGQNVAWYTSSQRKYYDYLTWFTEMGEVGMNYARVWMAAWGFSIFWNDVYEYDARQTNMTSLDRTLEIAEDNGIYIQLCLLHHGMFSATVNPMWPNSTNTWYTAKYGANPYGEYLDNPGQFFTGDEAKASFKNQLDYIVARWGYSPNIMSWELFNEVDWIETYTAVAGTAWHVEMANYLKTIDPYGHMVTTSVKSDSFLSATYQVFASDAIDYVNVHSYGIYNHVSTLPTKQNNGFEVFGKPILYDEVGYSGNGGADQYAKDPNNVTLHQELWAGALGGGAGTAMNWWWESWIETNHLYDVYTGMAVFASQMDLTGENYRVMAENDADYDIATLGSAGTGYLGYIVDDRVYAYIYDKNYALNNQTVSSKSGVTFTVPAMGTGSYFLTWYDTFTGSVLATQTVFLAVAGPLTVTIPSFTADIALIIEPIL